MDNDIENTGPDDLEAPEVDEDAEAGPDEVEDDPVDDSDEGSEDDGDDGEPEVAAKPARKEGRLATLARRAKAAEEAATKAEAALAAVQRTQHEVQQREAQQRNEAQERAHLETLLPEEREIYGLKKELHQVQRNMQMLAFQATEASEKATFQAKAATVPLVGRYADRVEQRKQQLLQQGVNVPRELILQTMIGEDALKKAPAAGAKQRAAGAAKKTSAQARQAGGRSDTAGGKRGEKSLEERLENVLL
jgi:hypothetical protein